MQSRRNVLNINTQSSTCQIILKRSEKTEHLHSGAIRFFVSFSGYPHAHLIARITPTLAFERAKYCSLKIQDNRFRQKLQLIVPDYSVLNEVRFKAHGRVYDLYM